MGFPKLSTETPKNATPDEDLFPKLITETDSVEEEEVVLISQSPRHIPTTLSTNSWDEEEEELDKTQVLSPPKSEVLAALVHQPDVPDRKNTSSAPSPSEVSHNNSLDEPEIRISLNQPKSMTLQTAPSI